MPFTGEGVQAYGSGVMLATSGIAIAIVLGLVML